MDQVKKYEKLILTTEHILTALQEEFNSGLKNSYPRSSLIDLAEEIATTTQELLFLRISLRDSQENN